MGIRKDNETSTILRKLVVFTCSYYFIFYVLSIIMVGGFKTDWRDLGAYPFRTEHLLFNPGLGGEALGCWLAMVLTYLCCVPLAYSVVRVTRKTWDYMATTSILHWVLCCIVNRAFPVNWIWWVTILLTTLIVSIVSEVLIYQLRELRDIELGR